MYPMSQYLNSLDDITCDYITLRDDYGRPDFDRSFEEYDIVHIGYFNNLLYVKDDIEVPYTCSVHHIAANREVSATNFLMHFAPFGIVTADPFCQRQLGMYNINGVELIPYSFDHGPYEPLFKEAFAVAKEPPGMTPSARDFTVGYIGCDSSAKRFAVIEEACHRANIPCVGIDRDTRNEEEDFLDQEKVNRMFLDSHVYVSAGWTDGGPLPPQEALLLGRPVISTRVGMMPELIKPGENGEFFDGTVDDLVSKLNYMRFNYIDYHMGAMATQLPSVPQTSMQYLRFWMRILEAEE
jgi:hypothetical protein